MDWEQISLVRVRCNVDPLSKQRLDKLCADNGMDPEIVLAYAIDKGLSRMLSENKYKAKHRK